MSLGEGGAGGRGSDQKLAMILREGWLVASWLLQAVGLAGRGSGGNYS